MPYSKRRKNLGRGRTKRSKSMLFRNNRFLIQGGKWEEQPPTVHEMGDLFNTLEGVNTLKKVIDEHRNQHIYITQFNANVLEAREITNNFMEQSYSKFLAEKSDNITRIQNYLTLQK